MADAQLDRKGVVTKCPSCGQRNRIPFSRLQASRRGLGQAEIRCGKCRAAIQPPGEPIETPDAMTFDAVIAQSDIPVVVDFWAPWCGPCRMVAPELAKVAARHPGEYLVLKVNTDAVPELGERYKIRSIPTMAVFGGAREVGRSAGARPAQDIEAFIESTLAHR
jgi:thioredoxin 2